jgi:riboflavin kinase/FMN adenylyltransferase
MKHIQNLENAQLQQPSIVTIGVFDGVHRGHQHLIRRLVAQARATDRLAVVQTFFPHPDIVLRGLKGRYYLTTPEQRAEALISLGVDYVITQRFDDETRQVRAADYVDRLVKHLRMEQLWVGSDFALGYKREGDVAYLQAQSEQKGFAVTTLDLVQAEQATISSTLIRDLLQAGEVERARDLLGRGYALRGEVIHGMKRGRAIGFPTANIAVWDEQVIPANGVYTGWALLGEERFMGMINVGYSPTFGNTAITVEAHLLDFDRDIYGQPLTITFEKYLRPEAKYDSLQALIEQIHLDCDAGRAYLEQIGVVENWVAG